MAHPLVTGSVDFREIEQELGLSAYEAEYVTLNRRMVAGDHWLDGEGYIGAPPDPTDPKAADLMWDALKRAFTSKNIIKEISDRGVSAILGQQPDYNFTVRRSRNKVLRKVPNPAFVPDPANPSATAPLIDDPKGIMVDEELKDTEQELIRLAMAAVSVAWDNRQQRPLKHLKEALRRRFWGGRAYLRQFVPGKFRDERGRVAVQRGDFNEAIKRIFLSTPEIEDANRVVDDETFDELAVVRMERGRKESRKKVIELVFLDDDNQTIVATIEQDAQPQAGANGDNMRPFIFLPPAPADVVEAAERELLANVPDEQKSEPLDLNGNLTVYEFSGEPLITEQIRANNMFVNLALTMGAHVLVESGFSELAVTNVELEMEKVPDASAPGGYRERPKKLKRGAGIVHNFVGMSQDDGKGGENLSNPSINYKEPTPIEVFEQGKELGYRNCLEESHQIHAMIAGDATPSGESRIMALADFVMFMMPYAEETSDAGIWLIETLVYYAAILAGMPGHFNELRATFRCRIYVGRLSAAERTALMAEVKERLRSRASYILAAEVNDDPDAELQAIEDEDERLNPQNQITLERARLGLEADRAALDAQGAGSGSGRGAGGRGSGGNPPPRPVPVPQPVGR